MTARTLAVLALGAVAALPADAAAQLRGAVRVNPAYESYTFDIPAEAGPRAALSDAGFVFSKLTEFSVPLGFDVFLGRRAELSISTGYVSIEGTGFDDNPTQKLSGMIDTEARLGINLVPDRLVAVVSGRLPTGVRPASGTDDPNILVPGFIAAEGGVVGDVLALSIPSFGLGTRIGGGLAGALPMGKFALGLGATYTHSLSYEPVEGVTQNLQLGPEVRARLGLQGPLARKTYFRTALVFVLRGQDKYGDVGALEDQPTNTNRFVGYAEVRQGVGNMQLTLYGFDVYRGEAGLVEGVGLPAYLPPGNLLMLGLRHRIPASGSLSISPRAEWRMSTLKPQTGTETALEYGSLKKAGQSVRIGLDITQTLSRGLTAELRGSGLFGEVLPLGYKVSTSGWRGSIVLTYRP